MKEKRETSTESVGAALVEMVEEKDCLDRRGMDGFFSAGVFLLRCWRAYKSRG